MTMMPGRARAGVTQLVLRAAIPGRALLGSRASGMVGILMYHRIAEGPRGLPEPTWNVTPDRFRHQLEGLLARGFIAWPLRRVLDHARRGLPVPLRVFVVTFDDGYESVYRHAWPVLRKLEVPATVFLATAFLDSPAPFPFDDWTAAGSDHAAPDAWRPLRTVQCREMVAGGLVELGAHTHTHVDFRDRPAELAQDLSRCVETIRERFGLSDVTFAYPFGSSDARLAAVARQAGLRCGLTVEPELVDPRSDPFEWGRFEVGEADTAATVAVRLDGWYGVARRLWRRLRRPTFRGDTRSLHTGSPEA
jgi:peptidoglycan/xylan/chitin deacetylase (PgdA/CDA1 family)